MKIFEIPPHSNIAKKVKKNAKKISVVKIK